MSPDGAPQRESRGRREVIPPRVTELMAMQPTVQVVTGARETQRSSRLAFTPFDDLVSLFVPPNSPVISDLLVEPACEILATPASGEWSLRMRGRAMNAGIASAHERRLEVAPWLPEGGALNRLMLVEFVPEWIEFAEGQGEDARRFHGPTSAPRLPGTVYRWLLAAYDGVRPALGLAFAVDWVYLGWWGDDLPFRWLALGISLFASFGLLAAATLMFRVVALGRWQRGLALRKDAGVFGQGWVSARNARLTAYGLGGFCLFLLVVLGAAWGGDVAMVTLWASLVPVAVPAWALHLAQSPKSGE